MENVLESKQSSFWTFISNNRITIPVYQRDYAHGRDNNQKIELIRTSLLEDLFNSIQNKTDMDMDFIYGCDDSSGAFNPVDGQQRLTTLFLLHWYVFLRADITEDERNILKRFSYQTRDSSALFCTKLVALVLDDNGNQEECGDVKKIVINDDIDIPRQIRNKPWFTGVMGQDPTIQAMLNTIKCIHEKFKGIDFKKAKEILLDENCPIHFRSLNLGDSMFFNVSENTIPGGAKESAIRDLYIKMNARGKPLTEFELFKAQIQKEVRDPNKIDVVKEYMGEEYSQTERTLLFGKINTEYTNLFFNIIDGGVIFDTSIDNEDQNNTSNAQKTDIAMMNYFNEIIRLEYFVELSENVSKYRKRDARDLYQPFLEKGGKSFSSMLEDALTYLDFEKSRKLLGKSFRKAISLLEKMTRKFERDNTLDCCVDPIGGFSEKELFKKYGNATKDIYFPDTAQRYGLFLFWDKYGIPTGNDDPLINSYCTWSRFVRCLTTASKDYERELFKTAEDFVGILVTLHQVFNSIEGPIEDEKSVVTAISSFDAKAKAYWTVRDGQFLEEQIKARIKLREYEDNQKWSNLVVKAESHFSDGHIWPVLLLSDCVSLEACDSLDYSIFEKSVDFTISLFDSEKKLNRGKEFNNLFEKLLLCFDNPDDVFGHLRHPSNMAFFLLGNLKCMLTNMPISTGDDLWKGKQAIVINALRLLLEKDLQGVVLSDSVLQQLIDERKELITGKSKTWRRLFIDNDLFGKSFDISNPSKQYHFADCIFTINENDGYEYFMLASGQGRRDCYSAELNSFVKYVNNPDKYKLITNTLYDKYLDETGFPNRYLESKADGKKEGFVRGRFIEKGEKDN